jgi:drug/metabolite transporter (DMT)-like permease
VVFVWGFTAILGRLISLDAIALVWHRMLIAVAALLTYLMIRRRLRPLPRKQSLPIMAAGLVIALHWITFFHAIKISNVSITLAAMSTGALFASIIEPIAFKRKVDYTEIILGLVVVLGLYLIFRAETSHLVGILVALLSAFLSALFSVINGKLVEKYAPVSITTYELIGGVIGITIFLVLSGRMNESLFALQHCTEEGFWSVLGGYCDISMLLVLGILATAWAFIESVDVMRFLRPYTVVLTINMEPIYGIILAFLFFGESEKMHPLFYFGTLIIIGALFTEAYIKRKRQKKISQTVA